MLSVEAVQATVAPVAATVVVCNPDGTDGAVVSGVGAGAGAPPPPPPVPGSVGVPPLGGVVGSTPAGGFGAAPAAHGVVLVVRRAPRERFPAASEPCTLTVYVVAHARPVMTYWVLREVRTTARGLAAAAAGFREFATRELVTVMR